jgi:hypothetical protein
MRRILWIKVKSLEIYSSQERIYSRIKTSFAIEVERNGIRFSPFRVFVHLMGTTEQKRCNDALVFFFIKMPNITGQTTTLKAKGTVSEKTKNLITFTACRRLFFSDCFGDV